MVSKYVCHPTSTNLPQCFQVSVDSSHIPEAWGNANATANAHLQKGSRTDTAKYRPISLTSVASKLFEHVIIKHSHIMKHIEQHNILTDSQHGFRAKRSIEIYTIICLKSVCRSTFADCRSQFLLDRLGRCLRLIVSYRGTSSHEFASQFGLAFFLYAKNIHKLSRMPSLAHMGVE